MCIFCAIVAGEIPAHKIFEDDLCVAFLDLTQTTKGHTLLVPKQHFENFLQCPAPLHHHMVDVAQMLGQKLMTTLNASGLNILTNVNEVAGQTIFHYHIHLIPRYQNKDTIDLTFYKNEYDLAQLAEIITS